MSSVACLPQCPLGENGASRGCRARLDRGSSDWMRRGLLCAGPQRRNSLFRVVLRLTLAPFSHSPPLGTPDHLPPSATA